MEAGPASKMGTNAKLPVLKDLYMVTDIEQARALLEATLDQEKQIHTDLENILLNAEEVESTLATVEEIPYCPTLPWCRWSMHPSSRLTPLHLQDSNQACAEGDDAPAFNHQQHVLFGQRCLCQD
jgi:hypothetical protein